MDLKSLMKSALQKEIYPERREGVTVFEKSRERLFLIRRPIQRERKSSKSEQEEKSFERESELIIRWKLVREQLSDILRAPLMRTPMERWKETQFLVEILISKECEIVMTFWSEIS